VLRADVDNAGVGRAGVHHDGVDLAVLQQLHGGAVGQVLGLDVAEGDPVALEDDLHVQHARASLDSAGHLLALEVLVGLDPRIGFHDRLDRVGVQRDEAADVLHRAALEVFLALVGPVGHQGLDEADLHRLVLDVAGVLHGAARRLGRHVEADARVGPDLGDGHAERIVGAAHGARPEGNVFRLRVAGGRQAQRDGEKRRQAKQGHLVQTHVHETSFLKFSSARLARAFPSSPCILFSPFCHAAGPYAAPFAVFRCHR